MRVLVSGSSGFIGGYIVQELLDRGYEVIGIDNHSKYGLVKRSSDQNPNFKFYELDARDTDTLTTLLLDCDHFIASAAMIGGISYFHSFPYDLLATNERIIASSCDAAIAAKLKNGRLKKVTYLSSSMVFESTNHWPSKEGDELLIPPPLSSYGFQKLAVEYFARAAWDQYELPFTILRPFNCVGIGEAKAKTEKRIESGNITLAMSHVVPDLIQKMVRGQSPLRILGDGSQVRHYTYGGDLARGICISLEAENSFNEDFNLSTSESTTVLELAKLVWLKVHGTFEGFDYHSDVPFKHDVQKRIPDVTKARDLLGFTATTTLSDMLDEVVVWVRQAVKDGHI
jgi:UDP-glucose 4-epimerase